MKNCSSDDQNIRAARLNWPDRLNRGLIAKLRAISREYQLLISRGEITLLESNWYVTHAGLLKVAHERGCQGIDVISVDNLSDPDSCRWVFKAVVFTACACKGFVGYGDADSTNVSALVRGAEMRIAETRAVNRALRKAYGIGLCSIEEIGSGSGPSGSPAQQQKQPGRVAIVGANGNGHHLRDRLLVLIRQQKLDAALVKAYAADFCDVKELRDASKEQIQQFIDHLSKYVSEDRDGLLCQLNSYAPKQESAA